MRSTRRHTSLLITSPPIGGHTLGRTHSLLPRCRRVAHVLFTPVVIPGASGSPRWFHTHHVGQILRGASVRRVQTFLAGHAGQSAGVGHGRAQQLATGGGAAADATVAGLGRLRWLLVVVGGSLGRGSRWRWSREALV
uniref:(northern house mosquito) hypothetical protein n=1 Tax=Culex pipiens TaxID=7175 RepID=A0A8D8FFZ4_CULPI